MLILMQLVLEREEVLFGKFRGCGRDVKIKADAWEDLARQANMYVIVKKIFTFAIPNRWLLEKMHRSLEILLFV